MLSTREQLEDRQAQLAGAPQAYADALVAKEQYLTHSADPRGAQLLALAGQRGRLTDAQDNVDQSVQQVHGLQDRLKDQIDTVTKRLAAMDAERQQLLTQ